MSRRVDKPRIRDLLLELVRIDSHSRKERDVALRLEREMRDLGAERILFEAITLNAETARAGR